MAEDQRTLDEVLFEKAEFVKQSSDTRRAQDALERKSGKKSTEPFGEWIEATSIEITLQIQKHGSLTSKLEALQSDIETPPSPPVGPEDEEQFFDLIMQGCSNQALRNRLIEQMPSLELPASLQAYDKVYAELLENTEFLLQRMDILALESGETQEALLRMQGYIPLYTRARNTLQAAELGKTQADQLAKEALDKCSNAISRASAAEQSQGEAEAKLADAQALIAILQNSVREAEISRNEAVERAETAESNSRNAEAKKVEAETDCTSAKEAAKVMAMVAQRNQADAEKECTRAEEEARIARTSAQNAENDRERSVSRANAAESRVKELEAEIQRIESLCKDAETRGAGFETRAFTAKQQYATTKRSLKNVEGKLAQANVDAKNAKKASAEEHSRLSLVALGEEIRAIRAEGQGEQLRQEMISLKQEYTGSLKGLNKEKTDLQMANGILKTETVRLQSANSSLEGEKSELKQANSSLEGEKSELEQAKLSLEQSQRILEFELGTIRSRLINQQMDNAALREQSGEDRETTVTIQAESNQSKSDLAAAHRSRVTMLHRIANLESSLSHLKLKKGRLQDRYSALQDDNLALRNANSILVDRVDDLDGRNTTKANLLRQAYHCVNRLRTGIATHKADLQRHKGAVQMYQGLCDTSDQKSKRNVRIVESWQNMFHSLLGDVPVDWDIIEQVREVMIDMPAFVYRFDCDEWFEDTACLVGETLTVDVLHICRCLLKGSLSFDEVRAIAQSTVDCDVQTRQVIMSGMLVLLEREDERMSEWNAVALLTLKDFVHRYLLGTVLERRVRSTLSLDQVEHASPLIAGLEKWACSGSPLAEEISAEATRLGLRLTKDGIELIADKKHLLLISESRKLSILWPGQFEVLYGLHLQLEVDDGVLFTWDLNKEPDEVINVLGSITQSPVGIVVKGFK